MYTLIDLLKEKIKISIKNSFKEYFEKKEISPEVTPCTSEIFGHYQCNDPLKLNKIINKSPLEIAKTIVLNIEDKKIFEKIEIAKNGFINFIFDKNFISDELNIIFNDPYLGAIPKKNEKIIVEFSSPNVAKELHVGHLRSTIIGESLSRLFEFLNYSVLRLNHIGDWGTQFGMLIAYIKYFSKKNLDEATLSDLTKWYKEAKNKFENDEDFAKKSKIEVVNLQGGEKESLKMWNKICDISRKAYNEIYDLLDVKIVERGESYYNPYLKGIIKDLEEKNLITISNGAKCIFLEGFTSRDNKPLPLIVQKSDGGFNYATTDIAAMRQRALEEKADRIIVVIDQGQSLHLKMVHAACVKAKYIDPAKTKFEHVAFGVVLGADGKKFKTREGEVVKLIELLQGAINKAKEILKKKDPLISIHRVEKLSHILGINAVKYSDLSCHRLKDYKFSYERMLKFEGNTSTFLLYSYVRIMGIKRKLKKDPKKIIDLATIQLKHPTEISLGLHLRRFAEIIEIMEKELLPNRMADYLYELSEKFNAFFRDCHVIGSKEQNERLKLCELTAKILKRGLYILGLETTDSL